MARKGDYTKAADCKEHFSKIKGYSFWVKSKIFVLAITDKDGNPIETTEDYTDQTSEVYGKIEHHHYVLKPLMKTGNPFVTNERIKMKQQQALKWYQRKGQQVDSAGT